MCCRRKMHMTECFALFAMQGGAPGEAPAGTSYADAASGDGQGNAALTAAAQGLADAAGVQQCYLADPC